MKLLKVIAAAIIAASATSASAKSLSYDFTGHGGLAKSYSFSSEGVDLTVSAVKVKNNSISAAWLGQYSNGLGITSYHNDSHQVDGGIYDEFVVLTFSDDIERLDSVTFHYGDSDDKFNVFQKSGGNYDHLLEAYVPTADGNGHSTYSFSDDFGGNHFYVGAFGDHDNYKIRGITAKMHEPEVSAVPLPAGGLLLIGGLAGLAAIRRKFA